MASEERDFNKEFQDNDRKYSYDFDEVLRKYMLRAFEPHFPSTAPRSKLRVLELGCYMGAFTRRLTEYFSDISVCDASSELVAVASEAVKEAKFHVSTFETFEPPHKYDVIFLVHTLEHLDDAPVVLARIGSWLAEGGRLFVCVPNADAPSRQIAVQMGLITHNAAVTPAEKEHGHRITYSFDTLSRDVRDAGLSIVHRGGVMFKPMANFQFDLLMQQEFWEKAFGERYLEAIFDLGDRYPLLCASLYAVCENKGGQQKK